MNILKLLRERFRPVLEKLTPNVDKYLAMIRPSKQPGVDYQCNFVMPLTKELNKITNKLNENDHESIL